VSLWLGSPYATVVLVCESEVSAPHRRCRSTDTARSTDTNHARLPASFAEVVQTVLELQAAESGGTTGTATAAAAPVRASGGIAPVPEGEEGGEEEGEHEDQGGGDIEYGGAE
jgi:hypothetical protein